ncbi:hypothetical protein D3C71_555860 [compost metagenome]
MVQNIPPLAFRHATDRTKRFFHLAPAGFRRYRLFPTAADKLCGHAGHDRQRWHILVDDRACRDHRSVADRHTIENDRIGADPYIVADDDTLDLVRLVIDGRIGVIEAVIEADDRD